MRRAPNLSCSAATFTGKHDLYAERMALNVQQLLDDGTHKLCGCKKRLMAADKKCCSECERLPAQSRQHITPPEGKTISRSRRPGTAPATIPEHLLGGFATRSQLWLVVAGIPVSQGSMAAVAPGVVRHDKGPELRSWRTSIHRAFLRSAGTDFVAPDCPMRLHMCLTMPIPKSGVPARTIPVAGRAADARPRTAPATKPDLDKLARAVGDALAPQGNNRARSYTDDSRIVELLSAETFPAPTHVHSWALPTPGVVIRVCPAHIHAQFPAVDLGDPGPLPDELAAIVAQQLG